MSTLKEIHREVLQEILYETVTEYGSLPWDEFNVRCWQAYGTGRTEPDEVDE